MLYLTNIPKFIVLSKDKFEIQYFEIKKQFITQKMIYYSKKHQNKPHIMRIFQIKSSSYPYCKYSIYWRYNSTIHTLSVILKICWHYYCLVFLLDVVTLYQCLLIMRSPSAVNWSYGLDVSNLSSFKMS